MYNKFFNFREKPFKLVPDPNYLFLSKSHEEALAHLTYVVSEGDGFVEITGEVGTGKTTLCRTFLENLDDNTEVAYIFNPKLNSVQLLKAINDEFEIPSDADNVKDLIDTLNTFLLVKKAEGKNVIFLIDEAHNLNRQVLEQIRLLSNLETTRHKLLQIILVGQPELDEMINSSELRSLRQRIVLSCYLLPLTHSETRAYIYHRMGIASLKPQIKFSRSAIKQIYKFSRGIPRLINIICDRTLLIAFGLSKKNLTGSIVGKAVEELSGGKIRKQPGHFNLRMTTFFATLLGVTFIIGLFLHLTKDDTPISMPRSVPEQSLHPSKPTAYITDPILIDNTIPKESNSNPILPDNEMKTETDFIDFLENLDQYSSRKTALKAAMELWPTGAKVFLFADSMKDDLSFFNSAAAQHELLIQPVECDLEFLKNINLPALLKFNDPQWPSPVYLTIGKVKNDTFTLIGGQKIVEISTVLLESVWTGKAFIPWKNFMDIRGTIPIDASEESVITLKQLLRDIGFKGIGTAPIYNDKTRKAVQDIQGKYGIEMDGVVGAITKIALYNEKKGMRLPKISDTEEFTP